MSEKKPIMYPFPETIPGGDSFDVRDIDPLSTKIDYANNEIYIPLKDGQLEHSIRLRALAKIKWSSPYLGTAATKASLNTLKAVEENRISHLLQRNASLTSARVGAMPIDAAENIMGEFLDDENLRNTTLFLVSNGHTDVGNALEEMLENSTEKVAENTLLIGREAMGMMEKSKLTPEDRIKISEHIEKRLKDFTEKPKPQEEPSPPDKSPSNLDKEQQKKIEDAVKDGVDDLLKRMMNHAHKRSRWGEMSIDRPELYHQVKQRMVERRVRATEEGSFVRDITRTLTDQKVFGSITRKQGGSVLIDHSGSMSLSQEHVEALVRAAPAVTVAIYNGNSTNHTGVLRVVVSKGRICDRQFITRPSEGASNVIDGPAIQRWLILQGEPRIWVSDGQVNGYDGQEAENLYDEVISLMRRHRVIRLGNVPTALRFFVELTSGRGNVHPAVAHRNVREMELIKTIGKI